MEDRSTGKRNVWLLANSNRLPATHQPAGRRWLFAAILAESVEFPILSHQFFPRTQEIFPVIILAMNRVTSEFSAGNANQKQQDSATARRNSAEAFNLVSPAVIISQCLCQVAGTAITSLFILFLWTIIEYYGYTGHKRPKMHWSYPTDDHI